MKESPSQRAVFAAGLVGLLGALGAGVGELLLHWSPTGYEDPAPYAFFLGAPRWRLTLGHFLSVFSVPLYIAGYWHLYERLKPAAGRARLAVLALGVYAFAAGNAWLGARVYLAILTQARAEATGETARVLDGLLVDASFYNERILIAVRLCALLVSVIFVALVARGQTSYPRWMALLNPITLVLLSFLSYALLPSVGVYLMPEAMNTAHVVLFGVSLGLARRDPTAGVQPGTG